MLERTADITDAIGKIVEEGIRFRHRLSSEQAVVAGAPLRDRVIRS
jgi:hypothetical protein